LVPRKGTEDVISAVRDLPRAELLIAGGPDRRCLGTDPDARRLAAWARREGVAGRTELLGRVPHESLPDLYRSADVVVCAPWYEPFGIVPLEAMACGVPVVATAVGGLLDTVVDGTTGIHVPPRCPTAIAEAVGSVLEDRPLAARLGAAGARRAHSYAWSGIAASSVATYRDLVNSTVGSRSGR
jgi:glycosyltransferase involved in cell wall biosynthesis